MPLKKGVINTIIKMCGKCKKPIQYPNTYCSKCQEQQEKQKQENITLSNRRYNQTRDKKYLRFYKSPEWNMLKNKKLQDTKYKCERCTALGKNKIATEVHHIKEIQTEEGWEQRLDYTNLKTVCINCHNYYHGRFQRKEKQR